MDHDWQNELTALTHMGVSELRGKYAELFGEPRANLASGRR